jgi:hypothetical protein
MAMARRVEHTFLSRWWHPTNAFRLKSYVLEITYWTDDKNQQFPLVCENARNIYYRSVFHKKIAFSAWLLACVLANSAYPACVWWLHISVFSPFATSFDKKARPGLSFSSGTPLSSAVSGLFSVTAGSAAQGPLFFDDVIFSSPLVVQLGSYWLLGRGGQSILRWNGWQNQNEYEICKYAQ